MGYEARRYRLLGKNMAERINNTIETQINDGNTIVSQIVDNNQPLQTVIQDVPQVQTVLQNGINVSSQINAPFVEVTSVNGKTGDVITEPVVGVFEPNHYYLKNTMISYNDTLYYAKANFTSGNSFNTNDWYAVEGTQITVDSALSTTSENPVQNKVITSALNNKVNSSDLAEVASSGSFTDLINVPVFPTVNNATLIIQKNGTTVNTFTANSNTDKTANITVPTTVAELSDASIYVTAEDIASTSALTPLVQTNMIADGAVTTWKIANKAVTSDKIDWSTTAVYGRNSSVVALTTSNQTVLTIPLTIFNDTDVLEYSVTVLSQGDTYFHGLIVGAAGGQEYKQVGTWGITFAFVDYNTKANLGSSLTIIARKDTSYTLNKVLAVAVVRRIG